MSIATVITRGFGTYSTVNFLPTRGFGNFSLEPAVQIGYTCFGVEVEPTFTLFAEIIPTYVVSADVDPTYLIDAGIEVCT